MSAKEKRALVVAAAVLAVTIAEQFSPEEYSPATKLGMFASIMSRSRERIIIKRVFDTVIGPYFYGRICYDLFRIDERDYTKKHDTLLALTTLQTEFLELAKKPFKSKKITPVENEDISEVEVLDLENGGGGGEIAAQMAREIHELMDRIVALDEHLKK